MKYIVILAFLLPGLPGSAAAQEWFKEEPKGGMAREGVRELYQTPLPAARGIGYVAMGAKENENVITIGVQYITEKNISVVDSIHCEQKDKELVFVEELYSGRTARGLGEFVLMPYVPLTAIFVSTKLNAAAVPPDAERCYDLYEQERYKHLVADSALWKLGVLSPEESKLYGYKYVAKELTILVSPDQDTIRFVATQGRLTHWIEMHGRYKPKLVKEGWGGFGGDLKPEKPDLIRKSETLKGTALLLVSIRRALQVLTPPPPQNQLE